ncbi:MAG: type III pantothenate kinase [Planctomycetota bacterium]|nr:MAG: type III pantothenate kinase [Planctomycetota bacterium]
MDWMIWTWMRSNDRRGHLAPEIPAVSTTLEAVDALLAVDVGNTRIGLAVWDDDGLHAARRLGREPPQRWRDALGELWAQTAGAKRRTIVISSVAPRRAREFADCALDVCGVEPLFVRDDVPLPMPTRLDNEKQVGADRICAAAAAYERIQSACAVASFGTAITIDCVSRDGVFLGGTILPGLQTACDALQAHTERLPRVQAARRSRGRR